MEPSSRTLSGDGSQQAAVSHNLRHMVDEIDIFLKSAADTGDQRFNAVRDRLAEQVQEMRMQIDELNQATLARVKRVARQADQTVQAHPYGAMSVAAVAGLVIGFFAARR
jgi:ElaB/YqjD/DUF883 family membrane-anchored ribosome-binding protein